MRRKLVAGNWKMNGSRAANASLVAPLVAAAAELACDVLVCPPAVYLTDVVAAAAGSRLAVGAQNLCAEPPGAFTGEIAAAMLRDVGVTHVLVGHSERRALYGETDEVVARKFLAAQAAGLIPILCVGETLDEREADATESVVGRQAGAVIDAAGIEAFRSAIVAYEPVWAIGTGRTASPEQAQAVHRYIRDLFVEKDAIVGDQLRLLYGGSVKAANATDLFGMPDVDGGLVGGASLKADEFLGICAAAR
jgi:triosephosphate isomerase (TIM)